MTNTGDLSEFMTALQEASVSDDAEFSTLLDRGVKLLRLTDEELAREFDVSRPTVTRWRKGITAPHPFMRKPVFLWMKRVAMRILAAVAKDDDGDQ